jgi:hypothetical protein
MKVKQILIAFLFTTVLISCDGKSKDQTKECLVGVDWLYPSSSNVKAAWKFSADGTFNVSNTMFGGMSSWGNWEIVAPNKIQIVYTKSSSGTLPNNTTINLSDCNKLTVGATTYIKD